MRPPTTAPRGLLGLVLALTSACGPGSEHPEDPTALDGAAFTFGVMGDLPYSDETEARFPEVVASLEAAHPDFVIHVGDIKAGSAPCSDSVFAQRAAVLDAIEGPMVYLPGDNEWTDCHRSGAGGYDPLDRLEALRRVFYQEDLLTGTLEVERQSEDPTWAEFVEHQAWTHGGVLFLTAHIVGSRNGLAGFDGRSERHDQEVARRTEAAVAWLGTQVARADTLGAAALVVAMHGNPFLDPPGTDPTGFEALLDALTTGARAFDGPVLLVHGDTHTFRVDQPLEGPDGEVVSRVTRLETYGDPALGWVQVGVRPEAPADSVFTIAGRPLP